MAPRKKQQRSGSRASGQSGTSGNASAQYNDLMRTAHEENRNGNPYDNSYTFTARGSQRVASKARKFIKAALLVGGAAGLAYFFRAQIGGQMAPILASLQKKYPSLTEQYKTITGKYTKLQLQAGSKYANIIKNANSTTPGFAGRTVQGWRSTSRVIGRARNGVASTFGKARGGVDSMYSTTRNGIGRAFGVVRGLTTRPRTVAAAPRLSPPSLKSKTAKFDNALHDLVGHKLYTKSVANARKAFPRAPNSMSRTSQAAFDDEVRETLLNKYRNVYRNVY